MNLTGKCRVLNFNQSESSVAILIPGQREFYMGIGLLLILVYMTRRTLSLALKMLPIVLGMHQGIDTWKLGVDSPLTRDSPFSQPPSAPGGRGRGASALHLVLELMECKVT